MITKKEQVLIYASMLAGLASIKSHPRNDKKLDYQSLADEAAILTNIVVGYAYSIEEDSEWLGSVQQ